MLLMLLTFIVACKKNEEAKTNWFEIEIVAQSNIDCGVPEIIFLNRQQEAYEIIGDSSGRYVALGLPEVNYPVGTKMYVFIHRPTVNESIFCTTLGPSWSQVFIESIK